jgi:hypothetical protein
VLITAQGRAAPQIGLDLRTKKIDASGVLQGWLISLGFSLLKFAHYHTTITSRHRDLYRQSGLPQEMKIEPVVISNLLATRLVRNLFFFFFLSFLFFHFLSQLSKRRTNEKPYPSTEGYSLSKEKTNQISG